MTSRTVVANQVMRKSARGEFLQAMSRLVFNRWKCFILCVSASLRFASPAVAQAPEITGMLPGGGTRGAATTVLIEGKNLAGAKVRLLGKGIVVKSVQLSAAADRVTAE